MKEYIEFLSTLSLFQGISLKETAEIIGCFNVMPKFYSKESFIRYEGDRADFIGIILDGTVQVLQDDYDGNRHIISSFGKGSLFGEAFACAGAKKLPVSIYAVSDCRVIFLDISKVLHPCSNACSFHSRLLGNLLRIMAGKNMLLNQKLSCISHKTTAEKIMAFLADQARQHNSKEFTIPYDRQALADYLGVDRSAMSAAISKLQKEGLIETKKNYFRLKR